jgi:Leucine-rich repeat (LRR) protein
MESQKKIKELIIQDQNIIKLSKNFFQNLSNLTFLDLSNNSISKISRKILQFPNMKHLIFNNNLISVIPYYLSELNQLEEIQLENNLVQFENVNICCQY